jgi:hypothetical protein
MRPIKMQIDYGKYGVKAPIEVGVGGKTLCSEQFKINKTSVNLIDCPFELNLIWLFFLTY